MKSDPVRSYLRKRRAAKHVVEGGLLGLVERWERTASEVARGYKAGLDDYLNDLDARQILDELETRADESDWAEVAARVESADRKLRASTTGRDDCLWGAGLARRKRWDPDRNWWYWRVPRKPGPELAQDLEEG